MCEVGWGWALTLEDICLTCFLVAIRQMTSLVVALVEVSFARVGMERRSKGLVVIGTLMRIPLALTIITHSHYLVQIGPISIIVHNRSPFLIAPYIIFSRHLFRI